MTDIQRLIRQAQNAQRARQLRDRHRYDVQLSFADMKTPARWASHECAKGHHAFCSGNRYLGLDRNGNRQYGRCKCKCHA